MKRLKAYQVSDGDEGCVIRFATNSATARRQGAGEIGCDWEDIESCNRKPEFDKYAPGPVPAAAAIDSGWSYECENHGCNNWANRDTEELTFSAAGDPYCCPTCMAQHFAYQRGNRAAHVALIELIEAQLERLTVVV